MRKKVARKSVKKIKGPKQLRIHRANNETAAYRIQHHLWAEGRVNVKVRQLKTGKNKGKFTVTNGRVFKPRMS